MSLPMNRSLRAVLRVLLIVGTTLALPLVWLASCQSGLIYFPRPYPRGTVDLWSRQIGGEVLDFSTSQGRQRAFLQGNVQSPRHLWIVCGGNGSVALDWAQWLHAHGPADDAWLLVDFPGYGDCHGKPHPSKIRETFRTIVPMAAQRLGLRADDPSRMRIFGHSLGAAAALIAATEFDVRQGVLLAPFTSTMDMAKTMTGLPLGFLVTHRFDNAARLDELIAKGPTRITILHGAQDEVIPVEMARRLAAERTGSVRLVEIPNAHHNDVASSYGEYLARALNESSRKP